MKMRTIVAVAAILGAAIAASPSDGTSAGTDCGHRARHQTHSAAPHDADGTMRFPDGFLLGAATAGFQVEMGCPTLPAATCTDPNSDWYQWVTSPQIVNDPLAFVKGDDPAKVCPGHYELFAGDFDLARQDGHDAFRLSIEWSRIFPRSTVGIEGYENLKAVADPAAVEHYHKVFAALRERGMTPLVTLNHYTLPLWIHDGVGCHRDSAHCAPRGWLDPTTTVAEIAKYAGFVAREYGDEVDLWTTLNEPLAVVLPGYLLPSKERSNPPALFLRFKKFKAVMAAMIEAHARMADAIRANDLVDADGDGVAARVGVVYAMSPVVPKDPNRELDRKAAENLFYLWNAAFLNAVSLGQFDSNLDGHPVYRADLAGRLDFVGLNYYTRITVQGLRVSLFPWLSPLFTVNPATLQTSEIYPRGIFEMSEWVNQHLGLPVYITENNGRSADPNDDDAREQKYLVEHLSWVWYALGQGVDIRGFFYWSLLDNYEWNQGFKPWGLYAVDPADPAKRRSPRGIATLYRQIATARGIPPGLAALYPVDFY